MLSVKDLVEDKTLNSIVNKILENREFVDECVEKIRNKVLNDNKIDLNDIPNLICIVSLILNNKPKIKIDGNTMKEIIKLIIIRLLSEIKYINLEDEIPMLPEQEKSLDMSLELLGISLIVTKKYCKCFNI
jgi:hypothetical protein